MTLLSQPGSPSIAVFTVRRKRKGGGDDTAHIWIAPNDICLIASHPLQNLAGATAKFVEWHCTTKGWKQING